MLASILAATFAFEVSFTEAPEEAGRKALTERAVAVQASGRNSLRITIDETSELRLTEIERLLRAPVDRSRLPLNRKTIFEIEAGQCFFCAEGPLGKRLDARAFVKRWSVVDYAPKGRLRFRIEPDREVSLDALGLSVEDVVLTARYEGIERVDLYWPTGGISWRANERSAREEAARSKKPLMIFPTAGT